MSILIRPVVRTDLAALKAVLRTIELFPPDLLDEMIANYLVQPASEDIWLAATENDEVLALAYCAPEQLTEGTFNLYAIGVRQAAQGRGIGRQIMVYLETHLRQLGHRILIVETSGADGFQRTRRFYENLAYHHEATIRDFWKAGEDKVIYWKRLREPVK
ncbi:MAG: GNAT family N-acetyltransferase [Bacteroidota bacterium]